MQKIRVILFLLLTFIVCFAIGYFSLDPDFGWHLKAGELTLLHGVLKKDPFSYTMPSFPFIDYEWLTECIFALLYHIGGVFLLSGVFAVIPTLAVWLQFLFLNKIESKFSTAPFLLLIVNMAFFVGNRVQVVSLLFFSMVIYILFSKRGKLLYLLPPLFLLWANMHGGFLLGLFLLALFFCLKSLRTSKVQKMGFTIVFLSLSFTLVNPYGIKLWQEVLTISTNQFMHTHVAEWQSTIETPQIFSFWIALCICAIFIIRYRRKFLFEEIGIGIFLLFFGLLYVRNTTFFLLYIFPLTSKAIYYLFQEIKKHLYAEARFAKAYAIFIGIVCVVCILQGYIVYTSVIAYKESVFYPKEEIVYLKEHMPPGNIFSTYDWGGYINWKLPQKKVFINGKMPTWHWNALSKKESNDAFYEYLDLLEHKEKFKNIIAKYNIDAVLLPKGKNYHAIEYAFVPKNTIYWLTAWLYGKKSQEMDFATVLKRNGFVMVFSGRVGVIYARK